MISDPVELRDLIASGPMTHLSTINPDGGPQVTVVWIGTGGDDLVSGLLNRLAKVHIAPDADFPAPWGPGYLLRYSVERISGVGPWASPSR